MHVNFKNRTKSRWNDKDIIRLRMFSEYYIMEFGKNRDRLKTLLIRIRVW